MGQDNGKNKKPTKAPVHTPSALEVKTYIMAASKKIELYRARKVNQIKKRNQELAVFLRQNNFEVAKAKMESTMRDEDVITAYDIISPICEILKEKVTYIMSSPGVPNDLHPTLDTLIYASSRLEIEELHRLKEIIRYKYGESYIISASNNEFKTVNENIIFKLSIKPIPEQLVMIRLKQVAKDLNIVCNFPSDMDIQSGMQGGYNNPYGANMGEMPGPNMPEMSYMNNPYNNIDMNKPSGGNQYNSGNPYESNMPNPYDSIGNAPNSGDNNNPYGNFNSGDPNMNNNNPYGNFNSMEPNMNNNPYPDANSNTGLSDMPSNPENPFNASNMGNNNNFDPYKSNFAGNDVNFNANNYNGPSEGFGDLPSTGNNNENMGGFGGFDKNMSNNPDDKKDDLGFP